FDINRALRVNRHAGFDRLSCARGQTQTLVGSVLRGSRTHVGSDRLAGGTVVLTGRIAGRGSDGHVDANRVIGNSSGRIEADGVLKKIAVDCGYDKYRDRRWGSDGAVPHQQQRKASLGLAVRGYLSEQRSPGEI